jgi:TfoX/Sxy family transcriptional regulator of competence genes
MAYDEGLAQRIREVLVDYPTVTEKKMFGGIAFMLHDYMFCGVIDDRLMARVGPDNYAKALTQPHVDKMDFTGREMKGYVYVDPIGIEEDDSLTQWVMLCADFVQALPPKKPKQKK